MKTNSSKWNLQMNQHHHHHRTWTSHRTDPLPIARWQDRPPPGNGSGRLGMATDSGSSLDGTTAQNLTDPPTRRKTECISCGCWFEIRTGPLFDLLCQQCFDQQPEVMQMEGGAR
jgi:hypothetical protein